MLRITAGLRQWLRDSNSASAPSVLRAITRPWKLVWGLPNVTHSIIRNETQFLQLKTEWDELFSRATVQTPFLHHYWARLCWERQRNYGERSLFIFVIRKRKRPVLIAPFLIRLRGKSWQLRFLDSLTPQYNDILVENSAEASTYTDYLWSNLSNLHHIKTFVPKWVRDDSPLAPYLAEARQKSKAVASRALFIDLKRFRDWDAFLRHLPSNLRRDHDRQWRRLEQHGATFRIGDLNSCRHDMAWLFDRKRQWLERRRQLSTWIKAPGTEELFTMVGSEMISSGRAWLTALSRGSETISAMLSFREGNTLYASKLAYEPHWHSYSPGRTLLLLTIQRAFQEQIEKCDLMLGGAVWKDKLSSGAIRARTRTISLGD